MHCTVTASPQSAVEEHRLPTNLHTNTGTYIYEVKYSYCISNMNRRDLCDIHIYAWAQEHAMPKGKCEHIRQIMTAHVT